MRHVDHDIPEFSSKVGDLRTLRITDKHNTRIIT